MSWISEGDRDCRYVPEHPSVPSFTRLIERFGIELPVTIQDLVRWGWLTPVLRVALPAPFLRSWKHFPMMGHQRLIRRQDVWIDQLWAHSFSHFPEDPDAKWDAEWFVHPLDRSEEYAREVRAHTLPTAPGSRLPRPVKLADGDKAQPWLDFFSTWQALQVFDLLQAARLHAPLLNTPAASRAARTLVRNLPSLQRRALAWQRRSATRWESARPVLEWIYQYRTLLGIWLGRHGRSIHLRRGAKALAVRLGLDEKGLRTGIRDVLLDLWRDLERMSLPTKALGHFRQDVYWGTDFLAQLTGRPVDPYVEFWDPPDPNPREWERLRFVLPFELSEARHELPHLAGFYLERYNKFVSTGRRYEEGRIRDLVARWWSHSYAFRRFCLAFLRLHRHYGGAVNRDHRIQLTVETPIDFLLLAVLFTEKLQAERHLHAAAGPTPLPGFRELVVRRAALIESSAGITGLKAAVDSEWKTTGLYSLTLKTRKNHFKSARMTSLRRYVADSILTFVRLRNYAAHHDKLDEKLVHTKIGATALEALLLTVFFTLESCPQPK